MKHEKILEIIGILISLIKGDDDSPGENIGPDDVEKYQETERHKKKDNEKIFEIKSRALHILHLLFKWMSYSMLGELLLYFKFYKDHVTVDLVNNNRSQLSNEM
jgi:hypothetical protein